MAEYDYSLKSHRKCSLVAILRMEIAKKSCSKKQGKNLRGFHCLKHSNPCLYPYFLIIISSASNKAGGSSRELNIFFSCCSSRCYNKLKHTSFAVIFWGLQRYILCCLLERWGRRNCCWYIFQSDWLETFVMDIVTAKMHPENYSSTARRKVNQFDFSLRFDGKKSQAWTTTLRMEFEVHDKYLSLVMPSIRIIHDFTRGC